MYLKLVDVVVGRPIFCSVVVEVVVDESFGAVVDVVLGLLGRMVVTVLIAALVDDVESSEVVLVDEAAAVDVDDASVSATFIIIVTTPPRSYSSFLNRLEYGAQGLETQQRLLLSKLLI